MKKEKKVIKSEKKFTSIPIQHQKRKLAKIAYLERKLVTLKAGNSLKFNIDPQ